MYRHGDVNLHEVSAEEWARVTREGRKLPPSTRLILARGEATGSVHELVSEMEIEAYEYKGRTYLRVLAPTPLRHTSDHETLVIAPDIPLVQVPERELDHFSQSVRRVID